MACLKANETLFSKINNSYSDRIVIVSVLVKVLQIQEYTIYMKYN
jgi:hypothetical protein